MSERYLVTQVDCSATSFQNSWKRLPDEVKREARQFLAEMMLCERMPAKLHCHKLSGYADVWTIHVTRNDAYKASFTLKDGVATMRRIALHDHIDGNP